MSKGGRENGLDDFQRDARAVAREIAEIEDEDEKNWASETAAFYSQEEEEEFERRVEDELARGRDIPQTQPSHTKRRHGSCRRSAIAGHLDQGRNSAWSKRARCRLKSLRVRNGWRHDRVIDVLSRLHDRPAERTRLLEGIGYATYLKVDGIGSRIVPVGRRALGIARIPRAAKSSERVGLDVLKARCLVDETILRG